MGCVIDIGEPWREPCCSCTGAQALKLAAAALRTSQSALGAYYRRLCARMDKPKAVTAAAHKLARLIYAMLTKGQEYSDRGQAYYEQRYRQRVVAHLGRRAPATRHAGRADRRASLKKPTTDQLLGRSFLRGSTRVCCMKRGNGFTNAPSLEHHPKVNHLLDSWNRNACRW
jgi:hypothetical protein